MNIQWSAVTEYLRSEYLSFLWVLLALYLLVWLLALIFSYYRTPGENSTYVALCRNSWAVAFGIHLFLSMMAIIIWVRQNGDFDTFWAFLAPYIVVATVDALFVLVALNAASKAKSYISWE
ncbi:MAG: hypothetical protein WCK89_14075 [bacterium]